MFFNTSALNTYKGIWPMLIIDIVASNFMLIYYYYKKLKFSNTKPYFTLLFFLTKIISNISLDVTYTRIIQ